MKLLSSLVVGVSSASPAFNFLPDADCGKTEDKVSEGGSFTLSIIVIGDGGFTHNCSTIYDPAVGVAEDECLEWIPEQLLSDEEGLDITLLAHDEDGKQAMCMKWELAFDGKGSGQEVWAPPIVDAANRRAAMDAMVNAAVAETDFASDPQEPYRNNTEANRIQSMHYYFDSMTKMSHRCVPKDEPAYWNSGPPPFNSSFLPRIPNPFSPWAFPSTAKNVLQMRLGHAMLAATGTIWSIDRSCKDAWNIGYLPGFHESCVATIPGFPHCHINCQQTWSFGPGGVVKKGISSLTHHVRSPDIMLVDDSSTEIGEYGDLGCGDDNKALFA